MVLQVIFKVLSCNFLSSVLLLMVTDGREKLAPPHQTYSCELHPPSTTISQKLTKSVMRVQVIKLGVDNMVVREEMEMMAQQNQQNYFFYSQWPSFQIRQGLIKGRRWRIQQATQEICNNQMI